MPVDQNFKDKKLERPLAIGQDIFANIGPENWVGAGGVGQRCKS